MVVWWPWVFYMYNASQVSHKRQKRWRGAFLLNFQESLFFSMELYLGGQLCCKCMTKSFVSYPFNNIQAYKYNILMKLQGAIASTVIVIAGILVCIVVRLPIGLPPAPWSLCLVLLYMGVFWKVEKVGDLKKKFRWGISVWIYRGPWVFHMCNMSWISHEKAKKRGWGLLCHLNQSYWKLYEMDKSNLKNFLFVFWGGPSIRSLMRCSWMHEIRFGKVTSHDIMQAKYLSERQEGFFFGRFELSGGFACWIQ